MIGNGKWESAEGICIVVFRARLEGNAINAGTEGESPALNA